MNILILGGAGFLGNSLVRACLAQGGNHVVVVDSLDPSLRSEKANLADTLEFIEFVEGDIRDVPLLRDLVKQQDLVFNCAAQTSHTQSISNACHHLGEDDLSARGRVIGQGAIVCRR